MAYTNFIPTVWAEKIERDLEKACVFAEDCNREYEGEVSKQGDRVRILGVGKPTIRSLARSSASSNITGPEEVEDTSVTLDIDQIRYFNYMVGDIDKAQAVKGLEGALQEETSEELAAAVDKTIADLATDSNVKKLYSSVPKVVAGAASAGEKNVLDVLDEAIQKLYENDVNPKSMITVTVSPRFYTLFRKEYQILDTNNSDYLKHGFIGMYNNVRVKMSNQVKTSQTSSAGDTDNIMIRTSRAIAHVLAKTHTEAYRPEQKFADAVKGYVLFGNKVVRPKEVININVKY